MDLKEINMKKLQFRVIRVLIFCLLAANWLALLPGSTTVFAMGGRPGGLPNSQIVDPPTFKQDSGNGCQKSPSDFDTTPRTDPKFMNGKAHYRVLTINQGGGKCDHLSWDIHKTVPKAAMTSCLFFMHLSDIDSNAGINLKFLDKGGHQIVEQSQGAPGPFRAKVKGVHTVQADFGVGVDPGTKVDIGILFVDCDSNDSGVK
jgi:hypothetical protein